MLPFSAHTITSDVSIAETAKAAEYFLSDGVIVTGSSTNVPADTDELKGKLSHLMRLWYLSHRRLAKAQASLHIRAVSPEPSPFRTHEVWK